MVANTLNVNVDNSTIEISGNNLRVKALGITGAQIAAGAVTDAKITGPIATSKLSSSSVTIINGSGISGGAAVQLGGSLTLAVDSTVLRTTGSQTKTTGTLTISDTTQSTSISSGCLVLGGGLGVARNITCGAILTAAGITDGTAVMALGNLSSVGSIACTSINCGNTVTANTLSSAIVNSTSITCTSLTATNLSGISNLTITGTMRAGTLTDGTASLSGGILTGLITFSATNLSASSNVSGSTMNTGSLTATGTIAGNVVNGTTMAATQLTVGSSVLTNGRLTNLATPTSSGDAANKAYVDTRLQPNYSTTETSLGITWIDGKTVYQKVVNMGTLPSKNNSKTVAHGIVTPQTWVNMRVMAAGSSTRCPTYGTYITPDRYSEVNCNTTNVIFYSIDDSWSSYTGIAILQYTKV